MQHDLLIWDFNGTILNDVRAGIDAINALLERRGMPLLPGENAYRQIFCFPITEYYRRLGFDFSKEPFETVAREWVTEYRRRTETLVPVDGVRETLDAVRQAGIPQMVLSSSEIGLLRRQLERLGFSEYFSEVLGLDNVYAGGKTELARRWGAGKCHQALLVGDTTHDRETAQTLDCNCVLFSGGHESSESLARCGVPVIGDIRLLVDFL